MMYPLSGQLPLTPGATTRKSRPLPPRPSQQQQSQDRAACSGNHSRNRTFGNSNLSLSYTSANSAQRNNGSPIMERDDIVGSHMLSESENVSDHTPPLSNGAIANQAIYHDQWKRLGFIGKGSYGQVYRALDITSGYIFAVKTVNSKEIKRRTLVQALQDERETLKELEHPNIVRYLGFGEDEGVLNIFLEYVPGGTIRSCLNIHGKFKEEVTKSFASQILQGLSYLHSKSILHRDLKSENILVEPRGICKISDFGISKKALEADRGRLYSIMKGTVAYMAPEMIDNKNKGYNSKVDIWSVGCIVFEMWTGKTPWIGRQDVQILMKLFEEEIAPTSGPPLPDDILLSATAESFRQEFFYFDPEKRSSAVELLQHAYLKLPPRWTFPRVEEMGQVSDTSSESIITLSKNIHPPHVRPSHNDIGTGTSYLMKGQDSLFESIYSDIKATAAEFNLSVTDHTQRSPSPAWTMYSDVIDPRASSPPLVPITPPLRPRKQRNFSNLGNHTSRLNASSRLPMHDTVPDDTEDPPSRQTPPARSKRQPYVYQPPPLPEINVFSPYSRHLVPPTSIRCSNPISQTFSRRNNHSKPVTAKLLTLLTDVNMPLPESDDDSDDDDRYSSSAWKRPPVDIPIRPSQGIKPVESASDWNIPPIHLHHQPLSPSAIPRPSVETVYKGFLSENLENIDLSNASRGTVSRMKSIREVVEARLSQAQIAPAVSQKRAHFWNSHMKEIDFRLSREV